MNRFHLEYTQDARDDLKQLAYIISEQYKAPITAAKYLNEIEKEILKLLHCADSFKIQNR